MRDERSDLALLRAYHFDGDEAAREELIESYVPLVRALATRYANRGEELDDLVQVGTIGLINAIDRFDLDRGVRLPTYAVPYIVGEIKRHFRDKGWAVRVPRRLQELSIRVYELLEELPAKYGRSPTISELAEAANANEEEILEALESATAYRASSLSAQPENHEGAELDPLSRLGDPDAGYATAEDRTLIAEGLEVLDDREREIVHLRFYAELTQSQIAQRIGISQMHVSRLLRRALEKMSGQIGATVLEVRDAAGRDG